jgi:hypothetical protein
MLLRSGLAKTPKFLAADGYYSLPHGCSFSSNALVSSAAIVESATTAVAAVSKRDQVE